MFQSPQWGSNSKVTIAKFKCFKDGFSPRNGEVILKKLVNFSSYFKQSFSPRNGEVILKITYAHKYGDIRVSVPAMGK